MNNNQNKKMSKKEFDNLFPTKAKILDYIIKHRLKDVAECPNCGSPLDYYFKPLRGRKAYLCTYCMQQLYVLAGCGSWDHCRIAPEDLMDVLFDMLSARNGVSSHEIQTKYGFSKNTAPRILNGIREQMGKCLDFQLEGVVEVDEVYLTNEFIGNFSLYPVDRKKGRGTPSIICIVMAERGNNGRGLIFPILSADADCLCEAIEKYIKKGSIISSDQWAGYPAAIAKSNFYSGSNFIHKIVNHNDPNPKTRFVNGMASTNLCESMISNFKFYLRSFRTINPENLIFYCNEFNFKYSTRGLYDRGIETFIKSFPSISETYSRLGTQKLIA